MSNAPSEAGSANPAAVTVLDLGDYASTVFQQAGGVAGQKILLAWGVEWLVERSMRHNPPLPLELEQAIEITEDVVMPLARVVAGGTDLVVQGPGATVLAQLMTTAEGPQSVYPLDRIEDRFNQLVEVSQGRPATLSDGPIHPSAFAAMLNLREFMHHLRFERVSIRP